MNIIFYTNFLFCLTLILKILHLKKINCNFTNKKSKRNIINIIYKKNLNNNNRNKTQIIDTCHK